MRSRESLRCFVGVLAIVLLVAPVWAEDSEAPLSCNTGEYGYDYWTFAVNGDGPCPVDCGSYSTGGNTPTIACDYSGEAECTGIQYFVTGNPGADHAAIQVQAPAPVGFEESLDGIKVSLPCVGDATVTGLGVNSCHERTFRFNSDAFKNGQFIVVAQGLRGVTKTGVAARKGNGRKGYCSIAGIGDLLPEEELIEGCVPSCGDFDENQTITKTEILNFKECLLEFEFWLDTGAVKSVTLLNPEDDCDFIAFDVGEMDLTIPDGEGTATITASFGDGFISAGSDSCSCRVIGGRVYCWGRPCPK